MKDRTLAELRGGIPTLDEVLAVAKLSVVLEIKLDAVRARYPGVEQKVIAAIEQRRLTEATIVMAVGSSGSGVWGQS